MLRHFQVAFSLLFLGTSAASLAAPTKAEAPIGQNT